MFSVRIRYRLIPLWQEISIKTPMTPQRIDRVRFLRRFSRDESSERTVPEVDFVLKRLSHRESEIVGEVVGR